MNSRLKIVKLYGGLGNMLFQYAMGENLKHKGYCVRYFREPGVSQTATDLERLLGKIDYCDKTDLESVGYSFSGRLHYRLMRRLWRLFPRLKDDALIENGSGYNENYLGYDIYDGYWQSWRYIDPDMTSVFDSLGRYLEDSEYLEMIKESDSVAVHVRRGDYRDAKNKNLFAECNADYYKSAFDIVSTRINNPKFFVFSDDASWAKENLTSFAGNICFVDEADTLRTLGLMSRCKHSIIANSTFGWWGTWLSQNTGKVVVAPSRWYADGKMNKETKDLIPSDWIRI